MKKTLFALLGLMVLLTACGGPTPTADPEPTPPDTDPTATTSPLPTPPTSPLSPLEPEPGLPGRPQSEVTEAAVTYLAEQLEIDPAEISVVEALPVEWSDASLGCPREGEMYAAVITPGYLFTLEAGDQEYEIHTDTSGSQVVGCNGPTWDTSDGDSL